MKSLYGVLAGVVVLVFILSACDQVTNTDTTIDTTTERFSTQNLPSSEAALPDYIQEQLNAYSSVTINTYNVTLENRVENTMNGEVVSTTFHYSVSGTGETPQLDSFFLEIPQCAGDLVSYSPTESANVQENGIKWNSSVSSTGTKNYSMTFAGAVHPGLIDVTITRGSIHETATVQGPCDGVYTLTGSIFIDANEDGVKQSSESGIPNVPVELKNLSTNNVLTRSLTQAGGEFSFQVLEGSYNVTVVEDLLDDSYNATTAITVDLTDVTTDISGIHFGYRIDKQKVINDLREGIVLVNNEPTKYWVQQIRQRGKNNGDYTEQEIRDFLTEVENLLLFEPFQLGEDKEANALDILTRPIKTQLDEYLQQLLTAELNVISGRGAFSLDSNGEPVLNDEYNLALLIYGEAVACDALGTCPSGGQLIQQLTTQSFSGTASFTTDLSSDTELLSAFNGTGGIGTK